VASSRDKSRLLGRKSLLFAACALAAMLALGACSVGHGDGEVVGEVNLPGCRAGAYSLNPTAFYAQTAEKLLRISVQRGSDIEVRSDGVAVLVEDASLIKREWLGKELPVGPLGEPRIDMTLYLNASCPAERDMTPLVLGAVRGSIRFEQIYAPRVDKEEVRIQARFSGVRFEDPRNDERWAELAGRFDFLYVRGSPAQRFP
jgi:hypothetical protein